jgi:Family of unknown function (DUF6184)
VRSALERRRTARARCTGTTYADLEAMKNDHRKLTKTPVLSGLLLATSSGLLLAVGCAHDQSTPPAAVGGTQAPEAVTSAQNDADRRVVDQLSQAQCSHEQKCDDVGPGKKYVSVDACTDEARGSLNSNINAYSCARGVDQDALNRCLSSVNDESCSISLGSLFSRNECAAGTICIK